MHAFTIQSYVSVYDGFLLSLTEHVHIRIDRYAVITNTSPGAPVKHAEATPSR